MNLHRLTVLLAEDHTVVREGLRSWLHSAGDFEVVGEAATGREAVALARRLRPAVVVIDIAMPLLNGFEATRQILRAAPETKVLVLSAHCEDEYVTRMVAAGASGYVVKQSPMHVLAQAIKTVASGKIFFSPTISPRLREVALLSAHGLSPAPLTSPLTSRESEVLQLVAEGSANKQTAIELGISPKTVEKHRANLMDRLQLHGIPALTSYAIEKGLVSK